MDKGSGIMNDKNLYYKENRDGEIEYNELCKNCPYKCKQSYRATIVTSKNTKENQKKGKK